MESNKILIVGLGNPILGDDGVGWEVAEQIRQQVQDPGVDIECLAVGGLRLMEFMIGYDQAIVIDSLTSWEYPVGRVTGFLLEDMPDLTAGHTTSAHDTSLQTALEMGRRMGFDLPEQVNVIGIEAHQVYDFSETLTEPVQAAVPVAVERVLDLLAILRRNRQYDLT
ncbi:MAG: hydrogenase maturation protease [Anaerolineales bacterium]